MNRTIRTGTILGTVAITALAALGGTPAFADSPSTHAPASTAKTSKAPRTLASVQAAATSATGKRIASLNKAIAKVTTDTALTDSNKAAILGSLTVDLTGMKNLATKIAADTNLAQAETDYKAIVASYRVYSVSLPQTAYATLADTVTSKAAKLDTERGRLSGLLSGKDASKSTDGLQANLTDMTEQIGNATRAVSGLVAGSRAVTAEQYNGNHAVMAPFKASAAAARKALKQAQSDAKTIRTALR